MQPLPLQFSLQVSPDSKGGKACDVALDVETPDAGTLRFELRQNTVTCDPADWESRVSAAGKDEIINRIVAVYRRFAAQPDGEMRYAALGIMENGNMYVGVSTQTRGDPYFKDCAEQNMINAAVQSETLAANRRSDTADRAAVTLPKIREIYEMGGADAASTGGKPVITCPCGVCTDMLAKYMVPEGRVVVLPVNHGEKMPPLNKVAPNILRLWQGEGWDTTIARLNHGRRLLMSNLAKKYMCEGLHALAVKPADALSLPEMPQFQNGTEARIIAQATENIRTMRKSDPVLDVIMKLEEPLKPLGEYMRAQIERAVHGTLRKDAAYAGLHTQEARAAHIASAFKAVRCAVVRLADESYHIALSTLSDYTRAKPNAVVTALAGDEWSAAPVRELWYMECNPRAIAEGKMPTPSKEALERVIKHARGCDPKIHILPYFRPGVACEGWAKATKTLNCLDLVPGMFNGKSSLAHLRPLPKAMAAQPHPQVWAEGAQIAGVCEKGRYTAPLGSLEI
jgi:cytidine deaminase